MILINLKNGPKYIFYGFKMWIWDISEIIFKIYAILPYEYK